jgi:hypothetical protein
MGPIISEEDEKSDMLGGSNVSRTNSRDVGCGKDDWSDPIWNIHWRL